MSKNNNRKNLLSFLLLATGAIAGAAMAYFVYDNKFKNPYDILQELKDSLANQYIVTGGWINHALLDGDSEAHPYVYQGGISKLEAGHEINYAFIADAITGELLDFSVTES